MSQNGLLELQRPAGRSRSRLAWLAGCAVLLLAALALYFVWNNGTAAARVTGDFLILAAAVVAGISCSRAGRRGENARAWSLLAVAAFTWAAGQALWTYFRLANNTTYPFPSIADAPFLAYSIPAAAALFSFKRPTDTAKVGWVRSALDASVIAGSVGDQLVHGARAGPELRRRRPDRAGQRRVPRRGRGHHFLSLGPGHAPATGRTAPLGMLRQRAARPHHHRQHLRQAHVRRRHGRYGIAPCPWVNRRLPPDRAGTTTAVRGKPAA